LYITAEEIIYQPQERTYLNYDIDITMMQGDPYDFIITYEYNGEIYEVYLHDVALYSQNLF